MDEDATKNIMEDEKPKPLYGISIFMMPDGKPMVQTTKRADGSDPSYLECQMLLAPALENINSEITANKVMANLQAARKAALNKKGIIG